MCFTSHQSQIIHLLKHTESFSHIPVGGNRMKTRATVYRKKDKDSLFHFNYQLQIIKSGFTTEKQQTATATAATRLQIDLTKAN